VGDLDAPPGTAAFVYASLESTNMIISHFNRSTNYRRDPPLGDLKSEAIEDDELQALASAVDPCAATADGADGAAAATADEAATGAPNGDAGEGQQHQQLDEKCTAIMLSILAEDMTRTVLPAVADERSA
jgi:hypothetical protein